MTPAQQAAERRNQDAIDRAVRDFYRTGGWTDERRARVKPIFDEAFRRIAAEQAAAEAAKPARKTRRSKQAAEADAATAA